MLRDLFYLAQPVFIPSFVKGYKSYVARYGFYDLLVTKAYGARTADLR